MTVGDDILGAKSDGTIALLALDTDGIMTTVATIVDPHTYVTADFGGAVVSPAGSGRFADVPRNFTVTSSSHASTYNTTDPIVVTGVRAWDGVTATESLKLTQANGNETIIGTTLWDKIVSVLVPAQSDALGQFTFGVGTAALAVGTCTGAVTPDSAGTRGNNHRATGGGSRGVYVGTSASAHIYAKLVNSNTVTAYKNIAQGMTHPLWIKSIHESTTATDLVLIKSKKPLV